MLRKSDEVFKEMIEEEKELYNRVNKLDDFVKKCRLHEVPSISLDEIHLLEEQLKYMRKYLFTLRIRIDRVLNLELE